MFLKKQKTNNLIGFFVFTQSGYRLGVVVGVVLDEYKNLKKINVRKVFLGLAVGRKSVIDRSQIIQIKDKKIIVDDALIKIDKKSVVYGMENA